jgi:hypothetical protein
MNSDPTGLGAIDNRGSSSARRKAYRALNGDLTFEQRQQLDRLLHPTVNDSLPGVEVMPWGQVNTPPRSRLKPPSSKPNTF